jgi:putative DNA primase/helicase
VQHENRTLADVYRGSWPGILAHFGAPTKTLVNKHGPCPICGGKDRFRFDDKQGKGTWICSQCGAGDGPKLAMLLTGLPFRDMADRVRRHMGDERESERDRSDKLSTRYEPLPAPLVNLQEADPGKRDRMNDLWRRSSPIGDRDPAGLYLVGRLGMIPEGTGLRYLDRCPYPHGDDHPAMLAMFTGADGKPSGLHRTYLTGSGHKAKVENSKLSLGPLVDGGAVRLAPAGSVLGIAEGVETALAASILFGVPAWAALNAGRLAVWEPPSGLEEVVIFADNDASFIGQTASFDLQARIADRMRVSIETPVEEGTDWNDVLKQRRPF